MILSMTGFGKATGQYQLKTISAEVKSLNGKSTDIRIKAPVSYRNREIAMRNIVSELAIRGKIEVVITVTSEEGYDDYGINKPLFKKYFKELKELEADLSYQTNDLFTSILRIPNVVAIEDQEIDEEEWHEVAETLRMALKDLNDFRTSEGGAMKKDLSSNINIILEKLELIGPHEEARITRLKERMQKNLQDFLRSDQVDHNRFEQEVIFYIEKLDVNEEKVRLKQHCLYFLDGLNSDDISVGKKLSFISQEIGREINTLGSKAQDSNIQQLVVSMKEALEQIKEQLANVV